VTDDAFATPARRWPPVSGSAKTPDFAMALSLRRLLVVKMQTPSW
jgi:hypothetical protein